MFPLLPYSFRQIMPTNGTDKYHGTCLCGYVSFTLHGSPSKIVRCSCETCVKSSGASHQVVAAYPTPSVAVKDPYGWIRTHTIEQTASGFSKEKFFCCKCGCTLWTKPLKYEGSILMVRVALVEDGLKIFVPTSEMNVVPVFTQPQIVRSGAMETIENNGS